MINFIRALKFGLEKEPPISCRFSLGYTNGDFLPRIKSQAFSIKLFLKKNSKPIRDSSFYRLVLNLVVLASASSPTPNVYKMSRKLSNLLQFLATCVFKP